MIQFDSTLLLEEDYRDMIEISELYDLHEKFLDAIY